MPGATTPPPAPSPAPTSTTTAPPAPTPAPTAAPTPQPAPNAAARDRCVKRTNEYRATKKLSALSRRTNREACADGQGKSDAAASRPHGSFGKCGESAQNECPGWKGNAETTVDACLKAMFDEGPGTGATHGHYNNMMEPTYTSVACGLFIAADGSIWLVQDFYR